MSKDFIISDLHLNHKNIIDYCNRPFDSVKKMNKRIIDNWNKIVKKNDNVYILGDFAFGSKEEITKLCNRLKGNKILIKGNHDNHPINWYLDCGFFKVYDVPILYHDYFVMSHTPQMTLNNIYGYFYGHIHNDEKYKDYTSNTFCVCAERLNYTPIEIEKAIALMKKY